MIIVKSSSRIFFSLSFPHCHLTLENSLCSFQVFAALGGEALSRSIDEILNHSDAGTRPLRGDVLPRHGARDLLGASCKSTDRRIGGNCLYTGYPSPVAGRSSLLFRTLARSFSFHQYLLNHGVIRELVLSELYLERRKRT